MQSFHSPFPFSTSPSWTSASSLTYLRRVYTFLTLGVGMATAGAFVALYAGTPVLIGDGSGLSLPPLVLFGVQHWFVMMLGYMAAFFAASALQRVPGVNLAVLLGYTFITGIFVAPTLFFAQLMASQGATLSTAPVRDAFLLTISAFAGLTVYVCTTKKDFSYLQGGLTMGSFVLLGAMLLAMLLKSAALDLAIASVGVFLFCGYILYDTSRIVRDASESDAVGSALRLFLGILNLFLFLLRLLSSSSRSER